MSWKVFLASVATFLFLSCAGSREAEGPPSVLTLSYTMPGDHSLSYKAWTSSNEVSEVMGQSFEVNTSSSMDFSLLSKGMRGPNSDVQITIDTTALSVSTMRGDLTGDMANVIGKNFMMEISPQGKKVGMRGHENLEFTLGPAGKRNITAGFSMMFTHLPVNPVSVGGTWESTDTTDERSGGMKVHMVTHGSGKHDGYVSVAGYHCARLVTTFKGTIRTEGSQGPMQLLSTGTLEGTDTTYFAYKEGILVQSTTTVATKSSTEVSGPQNMTIPGTRTSHIRLDLTSPKK